MIDKRVNELTKLIRRLRNDPRLWDENDRVHNLLGKALEHRAKMQRQSPAASRVGPYSGLTHHELRQSGTCETDWV